MSDVKTTSGVGEKPTPSLDQPGSGKYAGQKDLNQPGTGRRELDQPGSGK
jgi:hypothetical protein